MFTEFPAPAGINRSQAVIHRLQIRVPRASGDKPANLRNLRAIALSSPRQRG